MKDRGMCRHKRGVKDGKGTGEVRVEGEKKNEEGERGITGIRGLDE